MAKKTINIVTSNHRGKIRGKAESHVVGMMESWNYCNLDRVSMLDPEEWFVKRYKPFGIDVYKMLNDLKVPIIVQKPWKYLENQQVYPLKDIIKAFGSKYFTCSQAYLLALALYEGYEKVKLVGWYNSVPGGTDFDWNSIVWDEIMCQNYWVGFLRAKGVEVTGGNVGKPITPDNETNPVHADPCNAGG